MNIFTAAITGLTIVIKKIGIGFKAVMTGLKIAIISVIDFIASVITAIVNDNLVGHQMGGDADCQSHPFAFQDIFAA